MQMQGGVSKSYVTWKTQYVTIRIVAVRCIAARCVLLRGTTLHNSALHYMEIHIRGPSPGVGKGPIAAVVKEESKQQTGIL